MFSGVKFLFFVNLYACRNKVININYKIYKTKIKSKKLYKNQIYILIKFICIINILVYVTFN